MTERTIADSNANPKCSHEADGTVLNTTRPHPARVAARIRASQRADRKKQPTPITISTKLVVFIGSSTGLLLSAALCPSLTLGFDTPQPKYTFSKYGCPALPGSFV